MDRKGKSAKTAKKQEEDTGDEDKEHPLLSRLLALEDEARRLREVQKQKRDRMKAASLAAKQTATLVAKHIAAGMDPKAAAAAVAVQRAEAAAAAVAAVAAAAAAAAEAEATTAAAAVTDAAAEAFMAAAAGVQAASRDAAAESSAESAGKQQGPQPPSLWPSQAEPGHVTQVLPAGDGLAAAEATRAAAAEGGPAAFPADPGAGAGAGSKPRPPQEAPSAGSRRSAKKRGLKVSVILPTEAEAEAEANAAAASPRELTQMERAMRLVRSAMRLRLLAGVARQIIHERMLTQLKGTLQQIEKGEAEHHSDLEGTNGTVEDEDEAARLAAEVGARLAAATSAAAGASASTATEAEAEGQWLLDKQLFKEQVAKSERAESGLDRGRTLGRRMRALQGQPAGQLELQRKLEIDQQCTLLEEQSLLLFDPDLLAAEPVGAGSLGVGQRGHEEGDGAARCLRRLRGRKGGEGSADPSALITVRRSSSLIPSSPHAKKGSRTLAERRCTRPSSSDAMLRRCVHLLLSQAPRPRPLADVPAQYGAAAAAAKARDPAAWRLPPLAKSPGAGRGPPPPLQRLPAPLLLQTRLLDEPVFFAFADDPDAGSEAAHRPTLAPTRFLALRRSFQPLEQRTAAETTGLEEYKGGIAGGIARGFARAQRRGSGGSWPG